MIAYAGSLSGGFVYEDTVGFPHWPWWSNVAMAALRFPPRSVSGLSLALTATVAGDGAFPARLVNLLWHLLNGLLVGLVARPLLSRAAAVFAVGLFLLHPVQTETVAYVASRPELIAATFVLGALLAVEQQRVPLAGALAFGALLAKEFAITAVLLVPLFAWWHGQTWTLQQRLVWIVSVGALAICGVVILHQRGLDGPYYGLPSLRYTGAQLAMLWRLLGLWPEALIHPQALTIDHDWRWITPSLAVMAMACWAWVLLAAHRHAWPLWGFAAAWTLVSLSLRLVLPIPDGLHERHLYTPSILWSLASGAVLFPRRTVA